NMERTMLDFTVFFIGNAKHLLGLILWSSCKSKVASGGHELASLHHGVDFVFIIRFVVCSKAGKCQIHICGVASALAGVRLVDNDSELVILMFLPNLRNDVRELFNRRYNDALAILYSLAQIARMLCPYHGVLNLHELLDRITDLLI